MTGIVTGILPGILPMALAGALRPLALVSLLLAAGIAPGRCGESKNPGELQVSGEAKVPLDARFLLGIATHQGMGEGRIVRGYDPATALDRMRAIGFNSFRDDIAWGYLAAPGPRKGLPEVLRPLETQIAGAGGRPLLILGGEAPQVPDSNPPATDAARRRFAEFARDAVASVRAATPAPLFELWNEWNMEARRKPGFDLDTYVALLKAVSPTMRRALPRGGFVVGAVGEDPGWRWVGGLIDRGALAEADGLSVHFYNHCAPEADRTAAEVIGRMKAVHDIVAARTGDPRYPLYATEVGWTNARGGCHVSEARAADNMAQMVLWSATAADWLKGVWFYELKDSGTNARDLEDNFGLHRFDNTAKPAACAVKGAWAFVRDTLEAREERPFEDVALVRARTGAEMRLAAWSPDPRKAFSVRVHDADPLLARSTPCDDAMRPVGDGWMPVGATPLLLRYPAGAPAPNLEFRRAPAG